MTVKDYDKLVKSIMAEAEKDGEPLTYEEAREVANMEMKANENGRHYEASAEKPRKKRTVKVDEEKVRILNDVRSLLVGLKADIINIKDGTEVEFNFNDSHYTIKLTKHRPPKK